MATGDVWVAADEVAVVCAVLCGAERYDVTVTVTVVGAGHEPVLVAL